MTEHEPIGDLSDLTDTSRMIKQNVLRVREDREYIQIWFEGKQAPVLIYIAYNGLAEVK